MGKIPAFASAQWWDEAPFHYILSLFMLCLTWWQEDRRESQNDIKF